MGKRKGGAGGLGTSLNKAIGKSKLTKIAYAEKHKQEELPENKPKLVSCLERDNLADFLYNAEISQQKFDATKAPRLVIKNCLKNQVVVDLQGKQIDLTTEEEQKIIEEMKYSRIPRRPKWDGVRDPEEQMLLENKNFIDWRRELAQKLETYRFVTMTPYEKNVEIWKQLWRVIEKSDIVIQILDGRNPLFYRCEDQEKYTKEVDEKKLNLLLINKADLVDETARKVWSNWFNERGVNHLFFSAKDEQTKIDSELPENENQTENQTENQKEKEELADELDLELLNKYKNTSNIVNRETLLKLLKSVVKFQRKMKKQNSAKNPEIQKEEKELEEKKIEEETKGKKKRQPVNEDIVTIGFCGFPNVGKSSVINVLCQKKLVGVDCRPGKTKNYQTIFLEKDLVLCDSPGLVFPTSASSKAEMATHGVLPIDNLKDFMGPMKYVTDRIPKRIISYVYKLNLKSVTDPEEFVTTDNLLFTYAASRGYVNGCGQPDYTKSARIILKDFVAGKLLYCNCPPELLESKELQEDVKRFNYVPEDFTMESLETDNSKNHVEKAENPNNFMMPKKNKTQSNNISTNIKFKKYQTEDTINENRIDDQFFGDNQKIPGMDDDEENVIEMMSEEDIVDLVTGKSVFGVKLDKNQRREVKWAIKRDETTDVIEAMLMSYVYGENYNKLGNKQKNQNV